MKLFHLLEIVCISKEMGIGAIGLRLDRPNNDGKIDQIEKLLKLFGIKGTLWIFIVR